MTLLLAVLLLVGNLASALTADPTRTYAYDGFGRLASTTLGAGSSAR